MTDKLTDNEIINALECCCDTTKFLCVDRCPLYDYEGDCLNVLKHNVFSLINRQKDDIDELQHRNSELDIELKAMRGAANSYKADGERLRAELELRPHVIASYACKVLEEPENFKRRLANIKADAIKEFAERLIADLVLLAKHEDEFRQGVILGVIHTVEEKKKEMVGDPDA